MDTFLLLMTGFGTGVLAGISPGPDTVLVLNSVARGGRRAGQECAIGIGAGLVVHSLLTVFLLFLVKTAIPGVVAALQLCGGAYLGYLGFALFRASSSDAPLVSVDGAVSSTGRYFGQGFLTNILNPKAILFYLALVAPVLEARGSAFEVGAFLFVVALGPPLWFLFLAGFSAPLTRWLTPNRRRVVDLVSGALFLVLAGISLASGMRGFLN